MDWESRREERRGFIEGRVRRVVGDVVVGDEGNGGLDVGMGMGRVGREDVVGLEGVVRGMSRGGEGEEGRMEVDG